MANRPVSPVSCTHSLWYPACIWRIELAIPGSPSSFKHTILAITDDFLYKASSPSISTPLSARLSLVQPLERRFDRWGIHKKPRYFLRRPCRGLLKAGVSRRALPGASETAATGGNSLDSEAPGRFLEQIQARWAIQAMWNRDVSLVGRLVHEVFLDFSWIFSRFLVFLMIFLDFSSFLMIFQAFGF